MVAQPRLRVHALVLLASVVALVLTGVSGTHAGFTDTASIESGGLSAATIQPVTNATCVDPSGTSAVVRWTNVDTRYAYFIEVLNAANSVLGSTTISNNGSAGSTQQLEVSPGDLGLPRTVSSYQRTYFTIRVRSQLSVTSTNPSPWRGIVVDVPIFMSLVNVFLLFPTTHVQCP